MSDAIEPNFSRCQIKHSVIQLNFIMAIHNPVPTGGYSDDKCVAKAYPSLSPLASNGVNRSYNRAVRINPQKPNESPENKMLVTFNCEVYPNTTYFGDVAQTLLKMMGKSGDVPGALLAEDVPIALERLKSNIEKLKVESSLKTSSERDAEQNEWKEEPVTLARRALPLIELLTTAAKANCYVMWDRN